VKTFKRILAAIVMGISVLVLVLSVAGIVGVWIARSQLTEDLVGVLAAAETRANMAQQKLGELDATLTQTSDQIALVEQQVLEVGADLEQGGSLLTAISERLGVDVAPLVDRARGLLGTIREASAALSSITEVINGLPFISSLVPDLDLLNNLSQEMESLQAEIQNLQTVIEQKRTEIIQGAVSFITTPASQIRSTLDQLQVTVSGYSQQLAALQEALSTLKVIVENGLIWMAVILTLMLLWLALSEVALFVVGWRAFAGRDILVRKQHQAPV